MRSLVNGLFRTYIRRYQRALRRHYTEPEVLQEAVLRHILAYQQETAFGIEHGFRHLLRSPGGFAERLPVRTYEEHLPYIERILGGEPNVLSADRPGWIATTSGTTGSTKYLPYALKAIRDMHLKGSWMSLACLYAKDPTVSVFGNRNLLIGGAYKGLHQTAGLPQGDISAIIIRNIPKVMQPFYIPDIELATAVSYEDKIERIAQLAAKEPGITTLGGVPTWNLPLYRRILELTGAENMLTRDLEVATQDGLFELAGSDSKYTTNYLVEDGSYHVKRMRLTENGTDRVVEIINSDFKPVAGGQGAFAHERVVSIDSKDSGPAMVELDYSKVRLEGPLEMPFRRR